MKNLLIALLIVTMCHGTVLAGWDEGGGSSDASNVSITDAGDYYTGTDVEAALQEIGSSPGQAKENTITVAKSGGDYATIQGAINASGASDKILIYPGTYDENVTTKTGGSTTLVGVGTMGSVVIECDTGTCLTVPSAMMSMAFVKNLKLKSTATGANASKLFYGEGTMTSFNSVSFDYNISNGYTEEVIDLEAGSFIFTGCKFDFDSTGTTGGDISYINASGAVEFQVMQGFATMSFASTSANHLHFIEDSANGHTVIRDFNCDIEATSASYAGHLDFIHSSNSNNTDSINNKISITTPSGVAGSYGQVYHLAGASGGRIHSTANKMEIEGFEKNYIGNINATEQLISHFDDIVATDGIIGDGAYNYVNSPSNGDLQMSGWIIRKVVNITADYGIAEDWDFGIINLESTTATDVTVTIKTTAFSEAPSGAGRTFLNSSDTYNMVIDPNGVNFGGSTEDRVIYPGGYIIIEKVGNQGVITSSYNTSFNIDISSIDNPSFHVDFSDASSVTVDGSDHITQVVDSVNSWNGTPSSVTGVEYGSTTQNGLNTALWNTSNTPLSFGNNDINNNTAGRGMTIIAVLKPNNTGDAIMSKYFDATPQREWRFYTSNVTIYNALSGAGQEAVVNYSSNYGEWEILQIEWVPGEGATAYKNGFLLGTSSYDAATIPSGTADLLIGASDATGADYSGEIGEIWAFSDTITADQRASVTSKLGAKWDIDVAVYSASDSSPFGRNDDTDTIKPIIDDDNLDIGAGTFTAEDGVFNGDVGIGTASPTSKLQVVSDTDLNIQFDSTGANKGVSIGFSNLANAWSFGMPQLGGTFRIRDVTSGLNVFQIEPGAPVDSWRMDNNGNVGIGTTSPKSDMHIKGKSTDATMTIAGFGSSNNNATLELLETDTVGDEIGFTTEYEGTDNNFYINSLVNGASTNRLSIERDSGNVGIGTDSPSALLDIRESTGTDDAVLLELSQSENDDYMFVGNDTNNYLELKTTTADGIMVWDRTGNVGIGTDSPGAKLHIEGGDIRLGGSADSQRDFKLYRNNQAIGIMNTGSTRFNIESGNNADIYIAPNGTGDTIFNNGNVGIGTDSPSQKLHIVSATGNDFWVQKEGTSVIGQINPSSAAVEMGSYSNHPLYLTVNNDAKMVIDTEGKVGIGTTSPGAKLEVNGDILVKKTSGDAFLTVDAHNDPIYYLKRDGVTKAFFTVDDADDDFYITGYSGDLHLYDSSLSGISVSSGNVGIGTTEPSKPLHVIGQDGYLEGTPTFGTDVSAVFQNNELASNNNQVYMIAGTTGKGKLHFGDKDSAGIGEIFYDNSDDSFGFETNGSEAMRITNTGNVGIGTDSPNSKLHTYYGSSGQSSPAISGAIIENSGGVGLNILTPDTASGYLLFGSNSDNDAGAVIYDHSTENLTLISKTGKLTLQADGNVGIGTTSPERQLELHEASGQNILRIDTGNVQHRKLEFTTAQSKRWTLGADNTVEAGSNVGSDFLLQNWDDSNTLIGTPLFIERSTGNVGIGTTSPGAKLEVAGGDLFIGNSADVTDRQLTIYGSGSSGVASQYIRSVGTGAVWHSGYGEFTVEPAGDFIFKPWNTVDESYVERMRVDTDTGALVVGRSYTGNAGPTSGAIIEGNVGIGTTTPNQELTIEGTMSLKEQASADADTAAYGQLWVKTATPNELWFTDDAGTDTILDENSTCFTLETPVAADDNIPLKSPKNGMTIKSIYCRTQGGTSAVMHLGDGTNDMEDITCDSDGQADDGSLTNNVFTARERLEIDVGTVTGTVNWLNVCFEYK